MANWYLIYTQDENLGRKYADENGITSHSISYQKVKENDIIDVINEAIKTKETNEILASLISSIMLIHWECDLFNDEIKPSLKDIICKTVNNDNVKNICINPWDEITTILNEFDVEYTTVEM